MKRLIKSLLLIVSMLGIIVPAWGQASTQGKEFWVSSSIVCSPANGKGIDPYIAISAEKSCTVTITGGVGNAINITKQLDAGSWTDFKSADGLTPSAWYPINTKEPATVCNLAGQKNMYGLHITASENISVYVILGGDNAMDASNILPLSALGDEYYVQDYMPEAHNGDSWSTNAGNMVTVTTILGTEDGTKVDITPRGDTYDNHASGTLYTIDLNKGQTYYLISKKEQQLAGTHIKARDNRKIAIYTGSPLTRLPNGISARDALFEQPMPVQYWGTQFIITRSLGKNGNIIGITASNDGTEIKLDGYSQNPAIILNEGDTYYIALQNAGNPQANKPGNTPIPVQKTVTADVLYIETTCPCEVYNYDTGNGYVGNGVNEIVTDGKPLGDPSSVWVSPIQQKINKITFGTCYTEMTKNHFLNVVTETATCQSTKLSALSYNNLLKQIIEIDKSNLLIWQPVPGNPTLSYARAQIGDAAETYKVFRLENNRGVIATVYGNGKNESYAYSAGSAAVEQGVNVNGETFVNGYRSDSRFCMDSIISFDAAVGTDEITRVDWNFGDGISKTNANAKEEHEYTSPGWYDVVADLYGHQVCTDESEQFLGSVQFSFRVVQPVLYFDTVEHKCLTLEQQKADPALCAKLLAEGENDTIWPANCWEDIPVVRYDYGLVSEQFDTIKAQDFYYETYNGMTYPVNPNNKDDYIVDLTINLTEVLGVKNNTDCDIILHRHIEIVTCLDLSIPNDPSAQFACYGDPIEIAYIHKKGEMGDATVTINGKTEPVKLDYGVVTLPISLLKPGTYHANISVEDTVCNRVLQFPIDFTIFYPEDIFAYKFNNVLAVYKPGYGGNEEGFEFTAYQWYRNGVAVEGANESIYHVDSTFTKGDEVYVVLTNKEGESIPSCPQTIPGVPDLSGQEQQASPAHKMMLNRRIVIRKGEMLYDIYGQRVE